MTMLRSRGWMLLVCLAPSAAAQDIGSFDDLVGVVEPGDGVRVTFRDGRQRTARLVEVTPEILSVVTRGQQFDLGEEDVSFIHRRVSDSSRNGAWIGFAAGAAAGMSWYVHGLCAGGCDAEAKGFVLVGGLFGAVGAWIGVGVDGLIAREQKVWPQSPKRAWSVTPLPAAGRHSVAVSLSF